MPTPPTTQEEALSKLGSQLDVCAVLGSVLLHLTQDVAGRVEAEDFVRLSGVLTILERMERDLRAAHEALSVVYDMQIAAK